MTLTLPVAVTPTLPVAVQAPLSMPAGMFLGEGLVPLPSRLVTKIQALEFVEMRDLMPESWLADATGLQVSEQGKCCAALTKPRHLPVTDILIWAQCYAAMVGVLSAKFPNAVPSLMAYQAIIIKASRDFDGLRWVQYDRAFRRQAAVMKDLNWARINSTLYSICFAGSAKHTSVCALCLSESHSTENCVEARVLAWLTQPAGTGSASPRFPRAVAASGEI